jgi:hypothetical protein
MASVVSRPPEWSFLIGGRSGKRDQKLKSSTGSVGAMSEKAMKPRGNRKHAHYVQRNTGDDCYCTNARPDNKQAGQVHEKELKANEVIEFFPFGRAKIIADGHGHQNLCSL